MQKYNSLDDVVVPEVEAKMPEEVKKEAKRHNPFYSPLTNLGLAAILLVAGAVVAPRVRADDNKRGQDTYLVEGQQIDLSKYTKLDVEGTEGIEVYVSPIRRNVKNWDNVYQKEKLKKWIDYAYIFDMIIQNNRQYGITLDKLVVKPLTGEHRTPTTVEGEEFQKWYLPVSHDPNRVYISPNDRLISLDDFYTTGDQTKKIKYTYYGTEELTGKRIEISFSFKLK